MRVSVFFGGVGFALATIAACASSTEEEATSPPPPADDAGSVITDAAPAETSVDAQTDGPACSSAGWCVTALPDTDLVVKDIWPFPSRAFAVAESVTLGVKVLEWDDASGTWKYIDDDTQNEAGFGAYVGRIWAPNENEIYYTVAPRYVYHGTRPSTDTAAWSFTRYQLEDPSQGGSSFDDPGYPMYRGVGYNYAAFGVWGTSSDDVYAWYANAIYHQELEADGGARWTKEYVAEPPDGFGEKLYILSAAGTGHDVWFSGARDSSFYWGSYAGACPLIVRKTSEEYRRLVDGVIADDGPCRARDGFLAIDGADGWLLDLQSSADGRFFGLVGSRAVVRISAEGERISSALSVIPTTTSLRGLSSMWTASEDQPWVIAWGLVARGDHVWDGGAYGISTISLNGGALEQPFYRIRGAGTSNLWAAGAYHALHKTTP